MLRRIVVVVLVMPLWCLVYSGKEGFGKLRSKSTHKFGSVIPPFLLTVSAAIQPSLLHIRSSSNYERLRSCTWRVT